MNNLYKSGNLELRVGITIYPSQDFRIDEVLSKLRDQIQAQFILLLDTSGQVITVQGEHSTIDVVSLASLVAGDMSINQEIDRLTSQNQNLSLIMREGCNDYTFISEVGRYLLLFAQVQIGIPLGWARLMIIRASHKIDEIVNSPIAENERANFSLSEQKLEEIIDSSLDSLVRE